MSLAGTAAAQSPDWSATAIVQPFPSPYLSDWDRYPSTGVLTVTYSGSASATYRIRGTLTHETRGELGAVESPVETVPGGPTSRAYLVNEIARWTVIRRQSGLVTELTRTGLLPEGRYEACAQILNATTGAVLARSCSEFTIGLPEPPRLLAPDDRAVLAAMQPMLQWTPVLAPPPLQVRYRVKLVELIGRQAPVVALSANIPMLDAVVSSPFLIYPLDALPLEPSKRYAWQVTATDADGRQLARTQVQSEIHQFETAADLMRPPPIIAELPDEVVVQPGVARLVGLRRARTVRGDAELTVSGDLTLVLDAGDGARLPVRVQELRLGYRGPDLALTGGGFSAPLPAEVLPANVRRFVRAGTLTYAMTEGLRATARFELPGRGTIPLEGTLQLTPAGWFGRLVGELRDGRTLAPIGGSPVQLGISGADVRLPEGAITLRGTLGVWGQDIGCAAISGPLVDGVLRTTGTCEPTRAVALAGAGPTDLRLSSFAGALEADFLADRLTYELRTAATLRLFGTREIPCGATMTLRLIPGAVETAETQSRCEATDATRDLGWITLRFSNLALGSIVDRPGERPAWTATVDITPVAKSLKALALGTFRGATFDQDGLTLPAVDEVLEAPAADLDGMRFAPTRVRHATLRQLWGAFDLFQAPPFRFELDGALQYADDKAAACLSAPTLAQASPAVLRNGSLTFALDETRLDKPCDVTVAPGLEASITTIRGDALVTLGDKVTITQPPIVWGAIAPKNRPTGVGGCALDLGVAMRLRPAGRLVGTIVPGETRALADFTWDEAVDAAKKAVADFFNGKSKLSVEGCEIVLGYGDLKLEAGAFTFAVGTDGAQQATFTGNAVASLAVPDKPAGTSSPDDKATTNQKPASAASESEPAPLKPGQGRSRITLDYVRGEITDGRFDLAGPLVVPIGSFRFEVASAALEKRGLVIDGNHQLMALGIDLGREMWVVQGDSVWSRQDTLGLGMKGRIPAVFDQVTIRPGSRTLGQGTIRFTRPFSMLAYVPAPKIAKDASLIEQGRGGVSAGGTVLSVGGQVLTASPSFDPLTFDAEASPEFAKYLDASLLAVHLPLPAGELSIDRDGLRVPNGEATGLLRLAGSTYDQLRLTFGGNVGFQLGTSRVGAGRIDFAAKDFPVAYLDRQGLHPAVAELVSRVLPARIPLPSSDVAYLQLRDDAGKLLVDVEETDKGYRVRASAAKPAKLVVPALRGTRSTDPYADVEFDLQLDTKDWSLRSGDIRATTTGRDGFDLRALRLPLTVDSVTYRRAPGGQYAFALGGSFQLFGDTDPLADVVVTVETGGVVSGTIDRAVTTRYALVPTGDRLAFELSRVRGSFRGTLGADASFTLDATGAVVMQPTPDKSYRVAATLRATPGRIEARDISLPGEVPLLEHAGARVALGNPRIPHFAFDATRGRFTFRFVFDLAVHLPALGGLVLPTIRDVEMRSDGLHIPSQEFANIPAGVLAAGAFGLKPSSGTDTVTVDGFALRVLGFRMDAVTWNWLTGAVPPTTWGFGLDLALKLGGLPATAPQALRQLELRALDVGFRNGRLTGNLAPVVFPTPLVLPGFELTSVGGRVGFQLAEPTGVAEALRKTTLRVGARLRLPEALGCVSGAPPLPSGSTDEDALTLSGEGWVSGRFQNLATNCTGRLGPFPYRIASASVEFSTRAGAQALRFGGAASLALPAPTGPDSIRVAGSVAVDLVTGRIDDATFSIAEPFRLPLGPAGQFFTLQVDQATIDKTGIALAGSGALQLADGGTATVAFSGTKIGFDPFSITEGSLQIASAIGVNAAIGEQGLIWNVTSSGAPRPAGASFRLDLPANITVDRTGLAASGTLSASLGFQDQTWATLSAVFSNDFRIGFNPVGVTAGQVAFRGAGNEAIAYVDRLGFWPGNVFAALPLPERLPLPSLNVAYLVLREPGPNGAVNVEQAPIAGTGNIRIFTRNAGVKLVIPALANGGAAPEITTNFSLDVNPQLMRVVGGTLEITQGANGAPVVPLPGLPVDVTRLRFAAATGGYQLSADARVRLPSSVSSLPLVFENLTISPTGFSGTASLGTYANIWTPGLTPVVEAALLGDSLKVGITGVRATFNGANSNVAVAGYLRSSLFQAPGGSPSTLFLSGSVSGSGLTAAVDFTPLPSATLPLGAATFTPQAIGGSPAFTFAVTNQEVALTMGGTFALPTIAPGFAVSVRDFKLSSLGITAPAVSITAPSETQTFDLFGAQFRLKDSTVAGATAFPAIAVAMNNGAVRLTLSGELTLLGNTTRFVGLSVSTAGEFTLAGAGLITSPVAIIPDRLFIDALTLSGGSLAATFGAVFPKPFDGGRQTANVTIAPDGTISGGGQFIVVNEAEGLETATTTIVQGDVTFHMRRVDVQITGAGAALVAELRAVSDIYLKNDPAKRVRLGRIVGNTVTPGITVSTDHGIVWGGIEVTEPLTLEHDVLALEITRGTARPGANGLAVDLSGSLELRVKDSNGSLDFENIGITESGQLTLGTASIRGGSITIGDAFTLEIANVAFADTDTTILVPRNAAPSNKGTVTGNQTDAVEVSSFLSFSGTVDIKEVFSGGVRRVLVYRGTDGSTHLLIDRLSAEIPKTLSFVGSLRYDEYADGFELAVGASAKVLDEYGAAMVGVLGQRAGQFRAGLFVSVTAPIPIVPGVVMLSAVGGGFFINPRSQDLDLVRSVADLDTKSAAKIGSPPGGKFAVLLYAAVAGLGASGASAFEGRALVTITDQIFRLDGAMQFFQLKDELKGDLTVQVGFDPAYVIGNVQLEMKFDKVLTGSTQLEFAAGGGTFAVRGRGDLVIAKVINGKARFVVTPSGVMVRAEAGLDYALSVISLKASLKTALWYKPPNLGAYVDVEGSVDVFGGAAGLSAKLAGALIVQPEPALYAMGEAKAFLLDKRVDVKVWVQFASGAVSGGLGENPAMAAAIADANRVMKELEDEAEKILKKIADLESDVRSRQFAVSREALERAWRNVTRFSRPDGTALGALNFTVGFFTPLFGEATLPGGIGSNNTFLTNSVAAMQGTGAPSDTIGIKTLQTTIETRLALLQARKADVDAQLAGVQAQLAELQAVTWGTIEDPVTTFTDEKVELVESGRRGPDGRAEVEMKNTPEFGVDDAKAKAGRDAATEASAATVARAARIRERLAAGDALLNAVRAATTDPTSGSLLGYARLYADAVSLVEEQHSAQIDFLMRRRQWANERRVALEVDTTAFRQHVEARLASVPAGGQQANQLYQLASLRVGTFEAWSGDGTQRVQLDAQRAQNPNDASFFRDNARSMALTLWRDVPINGLLLQEAAATTEIATATAAADAAITPLRAGHREFSTSLAATMDRQEELTGALHDLYDAALQELGTTDNAALVARRTTLASQLTAPRINTASATVTSFGFRAKLSAAWSGTHSAGLYEFLARRGDTLVSLGNSGTLDRWFWTTDLQAPARQEQVTLLTRGGAGATAARALPFTLTFLRGTGTTSSQSQPIVPPADVTAPTAPTVTFVDRPVRTEPFVGARAWTSNADAVLVEWTAADAESGIQEYEYRLAELQIPAYTLTPLRPWTSAGGRTQITLTGLALTPGRRLIVEVRARNGAGLQGASGYSPQLLLDTAVPTWPSGAVVAGVMQNSVAQWPPALAPACSRTFIQPPPSNQFTNFTTSVTQLAAVGDGGPVVVGGGASGTLVIQRPQATDLESGVHHYRVRFDDGDAQPNAATGWTEIAGDATASVSLAGVPYGARRTVTVVAVDWAGGRSAPTSFVAMLADPSPPSGAPFCAAADLTGTLVLGFNALATDAESGILGYQVRVLGPGGVVLRNWPTLPAVDVRAYLLGTGTPIRTDIALNDGQGYTVELRAVNGARAVGFVTASGPFTADASAPAAPTLSATWRTNFLRTERTLDVMTFMPTDPQTGLTDAEWAIGTSPGGTDVQGWTAVTGGVPGFTTLSRSFPMVGGPQRGTVFHVSVRTRNGFGALSAIGATTAVWP